MELPKIYKPSEIKKIKDCGVITKKVLQLMSESCKEGITTKQLDEIAFNFITQLGGVPACLGYKGFPASSCISIDDIILHGIPDETIIKEGMLVGIDCPVFYNGMYSDAAITVEVGKVTPNVKKINKVSYDCTINTIQQINSHITVGELCEFQEKYVNENGFKVIKNFRGHGIGKKLHEPPHIPYFLQNNNPYNDYQLKEGNVIAIEPTVVSCEQIIPNGDGWGYKTVDGSIGSSWEHTVLVTENGYEILT